MQILKDSGAFSTKTLAKRQWANCPMQNHGESTVPTVYAYRRHPGTIIRVGESPTVWMFDSFERKGMSVVEKMREYRKLFALVTLKTGLKKRKYHIFSTHNLCVENPFVSSYVLRCVEKRGFTESEESPVRGQAREARPWRGLRCPRPIARSKRKQRLNPNRQSDGLFLEVKEGILRIYPLAILAS
jgi:hypothetical protein